MTAITFPSNPTVGQVFTTGNLSYIWNGTVWASNNIATVDASNVTGLDAALAEIVDAAPAALNTLNELAAALGDDANFAATVTSSLADLQSEVSAKLSSSSPTISNPSISVSFQMEDLATEYLVSAYQSTDGNQITLGFSSWGTPFNSGSFAPGDLVRITTQPGDNVLSEPVTVVSYNFLNSQLVVTTSNQAVLSQLATLDVFGGMAYRTRSASATLGPQDIFQLKSLSSTPSTPAAGATLSVGKYFIPTNNSAYSFSLPANPNLGDEIQLFDSANYGASNPVTVLRNGNKINGLSDDASLDANGFAVAFTYTGNTYGWRMG